ncbi:MULTISPECIES: ester cyclase [unclassified Rathayibacter]|uniref:ester cyclase n=1 Tax=unclassified Rathayibacter TaxID=2609250 RepID=UPI0006F90453|nr:MULTISPECIES: ester cyclase [unclassified Rathayibacter]KQP95970.1 hypothetical protein ASF42_19280 [Rathayibacter sp. Leaf294]KQS07691.1 hypothetical protein ASG06_17930 [Rathayibacter sp. Leaf185]
MTDTSSGATTIALRGVAVMARGERDAFDDLYASAAVNHESGDEPPACRLPGPAGFYATALWLRSAYDEMDYRIHHTIESDGLVAVDCTMSGRQVGPFLLYDADGLVSRAWAPTGRRFAARQTHWLRVSEGRITEHWAVRDDLGQGTQLGWLPPTPMYLLRCAAAKRRALRLARE